MKKVFLTLTVLAALVSGAFAQEFNRMPYAYKWLGDKEVAFTYNGMYTDDGCFKLVMPKGTKVTGVKAPEKFSDFPLRPEGAVNLTYSPDSTMLAFTRANDLYVVTIADGKECRLTFDGTATVMNGYASWVYYEEILGRPSRYRAFWWSPDSKKLAFYHFDDTEVPMFPIYSPFGQDGKIRETHYPKVGEKNPDVKIGFVDVPAAFAGRVSTVWADFDEKEDQYFGIPFWSDDSRTFYVAREPRIQNTLDLYAVSPVDGSKNVLYHEYYPTWLDWIEGMLFTEKGLYMVRAFETGWQQVYFLGYDGTVRRLTDGPNWRVSLVRAEKDGTVYFTAQRDELHIRQALYKVSPKGVITPLTDESLNVAGVQFSPDGKYIWFNSVRSGLMQVWRMCADGSDQRQMTFDEDLNSWFPHVSPDGKKVVFIAYHKGDLKPNEHLANKNVVLRMMTAKGKKVRTIHTLFGGQGTINVNSWAPDSRHIAFVSYRLP